MASARATPVHQQEADAEVVDLLLVNQLSDEPPGCFGGALAVSGRGEILAEMPPGQDGVLVTEL